MIIIYVKLRRNSCEEKVFSKEPTASTNMFFSVAVVFLYVKYTGIPNVFKKAEGCSHKILMYSSQIITPKN